MKSLCNNDNYATALIFTGNDCKIHKKREKYEKTHTNHPDWTAISHACFIYPFYCSYLSTLKQIPDPICMHLYKYRHFR